jgi:hypothetical protein
MNPEQRRIAIAEACGWVFEKKARHNMNSNIPAWHLTSPKGVLRCGKEVWFDTSYGKESVYRPFEGELVEYLDESGVPDYLNDLNAMHDADKMLTNEQWWLLVGFLAEICGGGVALCISANAAQRAEAFLKTLNLWKP